MPTTFAVGIDENPLYATRAEQDKNGDQIDLTYAKKSEVPSQLSAASGLTIISDVIGAKVDGTTITINQNGELESIGGGGGGDTFYATYGVTTFNEIVTANQAGKNVVLLKESAFGEAGYSLPLQTVFISNFASSSYAYFSVSPRANYVNGDLSGNSVYAVDGNDTWTTSSVYPISYPTSADVGKVLTSTLQGRVSWEGSVDNWNEAYNVVSASAQIWNEAAAMDEYPVSAGPGIDVQEVSGTVVVGVETPVDIVAGPGIAIDNPDGNTLRISNAMSEVVLWDGNGTGVSACTLSEHPTNFEYLIVYAGESASFIGCHLLRSENTNYRISTVAGGSNVWLDFFFISRSNLTLTVIADKRINFGGIESTTASYSVTIGNKNVLYKVVGVNRIANN